MSHGCVTAIVALLKHWRQPSFEKHLKPNIKKTEMEIQWNVTRYTAQRKMCRKFKFFKIYLAPRDSKLENNRNSHGWRRCNGECLISGPVTPKKKPTGFSFCWDSVDKMGEIGARFVCLLTTYCTVLTCSMNCDKQWACVCLFVDMCVHFFVGLFQGLAVPLSIVSCVP